MFTSLKRIIYAGWRNFCHNIGLSTATCFILTLVILLFISLFLLKGVTEHIISILREKADISVIFKEDAPEEEILKLKEELMKKPEVKRVEYVSKEEALEKFTAQYQDNPELMKTLALLENPFFAHLNINLLKAEQYEPLVNFLENSPFFNLIEKIDYSERKLIINQIFAITENVKRGGVIVSVILGLIAILVTFNTIKLTISNYKEEIKIQRLVGASNWFIRGPFFIQGIISGIFAVLFSFSFTFLFLYFFSPKVESFLLGFDLLNYFFQNLSTLIWISLGISLGLGVISSFIATYKYLKV